MKRDMPDGIPHHIECLAYSIVESARIMKKTGVDITNGTYVVRNNRGQIEAVCPVTAFAWMYGVDIRSQKDETYAFYAALKRLSVECTIALPSAAFMHRMLSFLNTGIDHPYLPGFYWNMTHVGQWIGGELGLPDVDGLSPYAAMPSLEGKR